MSKLNDKQNEAKKELRCDPKQLDFLNRCLEKGEDGIAEWNQWRKENPAQEIWLQGAELSYVHLEGADFRVCSVDGLTLFIKCFVNYKTDFRGVGLESCRIDEATKYLLEYNRRRMNCQDWYKQHPQLAWPAKAFFWISDYGRSTHRIIFTFFGLAVIFANIYYHWARLAPPGIVSNLLVDQNGVAVPWWLVPLRTLYFSIVTMTTLGFGDMFANSQSIWGHILLMLQVLLGYCLLGALITRFAVLFKSGVIPGEFQEK